MSYTLDGADLQLTDYATNIEDITVQMKLARYDQFRQLARSRLARGNGSFPIHKIDWPCTAQGQFISSSLAVGVATMANRTAFENEVRIAVKKLSRTKLNNMKQTEGKSSFSSTV